DHKPGTCGGPGACRPLPQACTDLFNPVCGCDHQTYGNACFAATAGVSVAHAGACGPFCGGLARFPCPGAGQCIADPRDHCDPAHGGADCGGICVCPATLTCKAGTHFDPNPEVCTCVPDQPDPCATVRCRSPLVCKVVDGAPVCLPGGEPCGGTTCGA